MLGKHENYLTTIFRVILGFRLETELFQGEGLAEAPWGIVKSKNSQKTAKLAYR